MDKKMSYLDEIRKRLDESSENWFAEWNWDSHPGEKNVYTAWSEGPTLKSNDLNVIAEQARKDKYFIARSKGDIRFLLSEVELLREKINELEEHWDY